MNEHLAEPGPAGDDEARLRDAAVAAIVPDGHGQNRLAAGFKPITWGGGFAYVIPATAKNKTGAWELIQFLQHRLPPHIKVTVDEPTSLFTAFRGGKP